MNFKTASEEKLNLSCYQGSINETYANLVACFGESTCTGDDHKIDVEWLVEFDDGTVASIYNWKNGPNYLGEGGNPVESITMWNIGGYKPEAVKNVRFALSAVSVS